jgi:hypothetical protein
MKIVRISRHFNLFFVPIAASIVSFPIAASAVTLVVPGTSNPFLAGLPNGSVDNLNDGDSAPAQSPLLVTGVTITAGTSLTFSATGGVNNSGSPSNNNPDGVQGFIVNDGSQNGISGFNAPINSLIGLFLDNSLPTSSVAPSALDFSTTSSQAYLSLSPLLKQVFFIGDGLTGTGSGNQQTVVVPTGATRLFLASVDGFEWNNNSGQFTVNVLAISQSTLVPEPFTIIGTIIGGTAAFRMNKKLRSTAKK